MPAASKTMIKQRSFPWPCHRCGKWEVFPTTIPHATQIKYEGELHSLSIPALDAARCQSCGELVFDNHSGDQIFAALRAQAGLLQPEEIRAGREKLGLSLSKLAERLGVAETAVSDWEECLKIQPRAIDNLLREFFAIPEVRAVLNGSHPVPQESVLAE